MAKIFLTGATGFVGSHLAEKLLQQGHELRVLLRTTSNLRWIADLNLESFYGSLDNPQSLLSGLKDIDVVIHCAALTKALKNEDYYKVNFEGTKKLVDLIINNNLPVKRFVFISSQAAAGPASSFEPVTEEDEPHPVSEYGKSKLLAEKYILEQKGKLPFTIIRPPAVYGPRDTDVLQFFQTVKRGIIPKWQNRDKYASFVYVKDLVEGIALAAEHEKARDKIYFIADAQPYSWDDLARVVMDFFKTKAIHVPIPLGAVKIIAAVSERWSKITKQPSIINRQKVAELLPDFWICSPKKIQKELGFATQTSLENGVKQTLEWYVEHKWI
ncbi:NAD-dependent epimerase/dehydratase family protein [Caldithrix abyssi]